MTKYNILHIPSSKLYHKTSTSCDCNYLKEFIKEINYIRFTPSSSYFGFHTEFNFMKRSLIRDEWIKVSPEEFEIVEIND